MIVIFKHPISHSHTGCPSTYISPTIKIT